MLLKLDNGMILQCYSSDNPPYEDNCDSVEGYCLFNANGTFNDGGELDYNSEEVNTEQELYTRVIDIALGKLDYIVLANTSDCYYENFEELLLEEGFNHSELEDIMGKITNEELIEKIRKAMRSI